LSVRGRNGGVGMSVAPCKGVQLRPTGRRATMSQTKAVPGRVTGPQGRANHEALRASPMMAHLLQALEDGTDVGHYGRLVFVMVARHFLSEEEMVALLRGQPGEDEARARALVTQVRER